ncbi:nucleoside diphosphate kinase [Carnobacterium iners]|uniref:Nucleoside diphosphate kinase n=1 Tax=Carnobacterium iners TaxID=1073423 RepID=A0A1X7N3P2_9LACT|nr:nucleoside-diphosphate kinase [Carnobacterium iners]SEK61797.1 nucleoside diphosphate kinase [Carnobacterium iners]SMH31977.1 nucleoside diphosphate kinase [Carnobacterium iners]
MNEKTLILLKPDAVERNLIGKILSEYERNGLTINDMKYMTASKEITETHYAEHKGKPFFNRLVCYLTRSPIVAVVVAGDNAVSRVRALNGTTNPADSGDNTIRALYGISLSENTVHSSDSVESAKRERAIWFN